MGLLGQASKAVKSAANEASEFLGTDAGTQIKRYPRLSGPQRIPYLEIVPRELISQEFIQGTNNSLADNKNNGIGTGNPGTTFQFAMLKEGEISENYSHRWETTEMHSMVESAEQAARRLRELGGAAQGALDSIKQKSSRGLANQIGRKNIWSKVDGALVYKGSERRTYTFRIGFVTQTDPYNDVIWPIRELQRYSCAMDVAGDIFKINPPSVFKIQVLPAKFIQIENAALTDVQVNYSPHFHFTNPIYQQILTVGGLLGGKDNYDRDGYPKMAEVSLTFIDLMPLYRKTVGTGDAQERVTIKQTVGQAKDELTRQIKRKVPDIPAGPFNRDSLDKATKWRP